jgi:hypothetical protein
MALPNGPVTLTVAQIEELNRSLSTMRHDINNHLSLIVAAAELIKMSPEAAQRMAASHSEQPGKIAELLNRFTADFENRLGITR